MRKLEILVFSIVIISSFFVTSCKKGSDTLAQPFARKIKIVSDSVSVVPGNVLTLKADSILPKLDTATVKFGNVYVKVVRISDSVLALFTPATPPGNYILDLNVFSAFSNPTITVGNYSTISNPNVVIDSFKNQINILVDSLSVLTTSKSNFPLDIADLNFMKDLQKQFNSLNSNMNAQEKAEMAYVLRSFVLEPALVKPAQVDTAFYVVKCINCATTNQINRDYEAEFKSKTIALLKASYRCKRNLAITTVLLSLAKISPNWVTLAAFGAGCLVSFNDVINEQDVIIQAANLPFQATEFASSNYEQAVQPSLNTFLTPIVMSTKSYTVLGGATPEFSETQKQKGLYFFNHKTIQKSDLNRNIADITTVIHEESILIQTINSINGYINSLIKYLTDMKAPFDNSPIITDALKQKALPVSSNYLKIENVSDSRIAVTYQPKGDSLIIGAVANSTITSDVNFSFDVVYSQTSLNNSIRKTVQALYKILLKLATVSGNNQNGVPNTNLTNPLVVEVKDASGNAMSGISVTWSVTAGGGQVTAATTTTDASGKSSNTWKLGATGTQSVTASVKKADGSNVTGSPLTFSATIKEPNTVTVISGNNQTGLPNANLTNPLVVEVKDASGNAMNGITVTWSVTAGGGQVTTATTTTDASGRSSNTWKLGATGTQSVTASVKKANGSNITSIFNGVIIPIVLSSVSISDWTRIGSVCASTYYQSGDAKVAIRFNGTSAPLVGFINIIQYWDNDGDGIFEGNNGGYDTDISTLERSGNEVNLRIGFCWGLKTTSVKMEVKYISGTTVSNVFKANVPRP